jgi:N utilization substance protein A
MKSDFLIALTQLAAERNLPRETVLSAIEAALVSAYKKDSIMTGQDISVQLDPGTGDVAVYILKTVVEEIEDPQFHILKKDAEKIRPGVEIGDNIPTDLLPQNAGRIAAQTAKQVVMQRLREAERDLVYQEFAEKEGEVFSVTVQRIEPRQVIVELGRAEAVMPESEQAPMERYRIGQKVRVLLKSLERSTKGPEIIVSRADTMLVKRLFEMEVPEIFNGAVEIVSIAREPGSRSKVAVRARQDGVDPVGSCVGLRGVRIQSIVNELMGEKIDVVEWSREPARLIANALSPAQVLRVELDSEAQSAVAVVPDRHLSLAIGKEGQNARLAARLTAWDIDIRSNVEADARREAAKALAEQAAAIGDPSTADLEVLGLPTRVLNLLKQAGLEKIAPLIEMSEEDILALPGVGDKSYQQVRNRLHELGLTRAAEAVQAEEQEPEEAPAEAAEPAEEPAAQAVEEEVSVEPEAVEPVPVEAVAEDTSAVDEGAEVEAPAAEEPAVPDDGLPPDLAELMPDLEIEEEEPELVPAMDTTTSLRDLPEDIWAVHRAGPSDSGRIRFAEDIAGLKGGVTVRRSRTSTREGERPRKKKARASRRRR